MFRRYCCVPACPALQACRDTSSALVGAVDPSFRISILLPLLNAFSIPGKIQRQGLFSIFFLPGEADRSPCPRAAHFCWTCSAPAVLDRPENLQTAARGSPRTATFGPTVAGLVVPVVTVSSSLAHSPSQLHRPRTRIPIQGAAVAAGLAH